MRFLRWFETRLLLLAILGITAYAVLQPLIWEQWIGKPPPTGSYDLATLIGIMATVMALGLAAFGVVAFQLAERNSESRLDERAKELLVDLDVRGAWVTAKLLNNLSIQAWLSYDEMWRTKDPGTPYSHEVESDPDFRRMVDEALANSKFAVSELERIPEARRAEPGIQRSYAIYRSGYAYHLATKRDPDDRVTAERIVRGLENSEAYHQRETFAWVTLRLREPGVAEWAAGIAALQWVLASDAPEDWKDQIRGRYRGAFPRPRPADLEALLRDE